MTDRFTWDDIKAAGNFRKHHVTFYEAESAFLDPLAKREIDPIHSMGEARFLLIGRSALNRLLVVAHVEHGDDNFRIISARLANRRERVWYEEGHRFT